MKKLSVLRLLALLTVLVSTFSCNRGVGCPTNFSAEDAIELVINLAASFLL